MTTSRRSFPSGTSDMHWVRVIVEQAKSLWPGAAGSSS